MDLSGCHWGPAEAAREVFVADGTVGQSLVAIVFELSDPDSVRYLGDSASRQIALQSLSAALRELAQGRM